MIDLPDLLPLINEGMETAELFGSSEARAALERMGKGNEIMFTDDTVFKV
jgi:DNA replication licensing factor MCM3